jgi:hypothetical protein
MEQVTRICSLLLLLEHGRVLDGGSDFQTIISTYNAVGVNATPSHHFAISMRVVVRDVAIMEGSRLLITISGDDGINVTQVLEGLPPFLETREIGILLKFQTMLLNAGRYWITCNLILGRYGEVAHVARNTVSFVVEHDYVAYAPIILHPVLQTFDAQLEFGPVRDYAL